MHLVGGFLSVSLEGVGLWEWLDEAEEEPEGRPAKCV